MNILLMLLGVLVVYGVLQYIYKKNWTKGLSVKVGFQTDHAVPGDTIYLQEVVVNNKRLPLPYIYAKFQLSKNFKFLEEDGNSRISDQTYRNDVFSLLFYQKVTRRIPLVCMKRGVYEIKNMEVVFAGLFMDETMVQSVPLSSQIVVYPEAVSTQRLEVPFRHMVGNMERKKYLLQDRFVFRGIRDYESYDSMKDINWKASARTGSLMVNEFNETVSQKVCILLNLEPEGMLKQDRLSEESISIAAGMAQMLIERGIEVSLLSNGCDIFNHEVIRIENGSGNLHLNTINTALATIDLSQDSPDFSDMLHAQQERDYLSRETEHIYVMISANKRANLVEAISAIVKDPAESLWIVPYHVGMNYELIGCEIPSVPWEVGYDK
ncbi:MAG: DUF58 domain-containing protein [Lachnospira sp.]|nr:DUF58 domain-containing protein [Lachnospira sp.]